MPNRAAAWRAKVATETGSEKPVIERARTGLTVALGNGQNRLMRSVGPIHTIAGQEIDTDWQDSTDTGWLSKGKTLDFGIQAGAAGRRLLTPRPDTHPAEAMLIGRPQWDNSGWVNVPFTGVERADNRYTFTATGYACTLAIKPDGIKAVWTVDGPANIRPFRWPLTLTGVIYHADTNTLTSMSDGETVLWLGIPRWQDSAHRSGEIAYAWDGTHLIYSPSIPAEAVYPITLDPDFGVSVAANADDGHISYISEADYWWNWNNSTTYLTLGQGSGYQIHGGLRLDNINITPPVTVTAATLTGVAHGNSSADLHIKVYGVKHEADHVAPTGVTTWLADHTSYHTTAAVDWDKTTDFVAGTAYVSPDITSVVQELLDVSGFQYGYAIGIHLDNDGGTEEVTFTQYEHASYAPFEIDITYTPDTQVAATAITCPTGSLKPLIIVAGNSSRVYPPACSLAPPLALHIMPYCPGIVANPGMAVTWDVSETTPGLITGDLDVRGRIKPDSWELNSYSESQTIIAWWDSTWDAGWYFTFANRKLKLTYYVAPDGTEANDESTVAISEALTINGESTLWLRATLDVDNGASGHDTKFYYSTDGSSWTQLGTTVTTAGTITLEADSLFCSPTVGTSDYTFLGNLLEGYLFEAEIRDGINGTVLAHPVFNRPAWQRTTLPYNLNDIAVFGYDAQGNKWDVMYDCNIDYAYPSTPSLPFQITNLNPVAATVGYGPISLTIEAINVSALSCAAAIPTPTPKGGGKVTATAITCPATIAYKPYDFPTIAGTAVKSQQTSDTTTHTVTLPSGCIAGEQILIVGGAHGTNDLQPPTGWNTAWTGLNNVNAIMACWKTSNGTEGDTTVDITSGAAQKSRWIAFRIANCGGILGERRSYGTNAWPEPNSLNALASKNILWGALAIWDGTVTINSYPTGFTYLTDSNLSDAADSVGVGVAFKQEAASTKDPGSFGISSSSSWTCTTLACLPKGMWVGAPVVSGDDGRNYEDTGFYNAGTGFQFGKTGGFIREAFMRFPSNTSYGPPQGAEIGSAYIRGVVDTNYTGTVCNIEIYGNDVDSAVAPTSTTEFNALTLTTASYEWSGITAWDGSYCYTTPDISSVIQEVVSRTGYAKGNAVQVVLKDNGSDNGATRGWNAVDVSGRLGTRLIVEWLTHENLVQGSSSVTATAISCPARVVPIGPTVIGYPSIVGSITKSQQTSDTTTHTVTLPSGCLAGEYIVIVGSIDGNGTDSCNLTWPAGWTQWPFAPGWANAINLSLGIKISNGTEGGTTIEITSDDSEQSRWMAFRVADCGGVWRTGHSAGADTTPGTKIVTTGVGSQPILVVSWFASDGNNPVTAWPTNYTYAQEENNGTGSGCVSLALAARQVTTDSETPGDFTTTYGSNFIGSTILFYPKNVYSVDIVAGADDTYRANEAPWFVTNVAGWFGRTETDGVTHTSLRFLGDSTNSPAKGANIRTATLRMGPDVNDSGTTCNGRFYGNDVDSAVAPTTSGEFDALVKTTAYVDWDNIPEWALVLAGDWYDSPNLATIVQEIVDRPSYAAGSAIQLIIDDNNSSANVHRKFTSYDYWAYNKRRPTLAIATASGYLQYGGSVTATAIACPTTLSSVVAPTLVQSKTATQTGTKNLSVTFGSATTAGNTILLLIAYRNDATWTPPTSGWTYEDTQYAWPFDAYWCYRTSVGEQTITFTNVFNSAYSAYTLAAFEIANSAGKDTDGHAYTGPGENNTSQSAGSATNAVATSLVLAHVGVYIDPTSDLSGEAWSNSYSAVTHTDVSNYKAYGAYKSVSASAEQTTTLSWTEAADGSVGLIAIFKGTSYPILRGSGSVTATAIARAVTIPAAQVGGGLTATTLSRSAALPTPTLQYGNQVAPATGIAAPVEVTGSAMTQTIPIAISADDGRTNLVNEVFSNTAEAWTMGRNNVPESMAAYGRFADIKGVHGATCTAASITGVISEGQTGTACNLVIYGNASDDAVAPTTHAQYDLLAKTTEHVHWSDIPTWGVGVVGEERATPDIANIIQEIFDRSGWLLGRAMLIMIEDDSSSTGAMRYWASYDNTTYAAPYLTVTYYNPGPTIHDGGTVSATAITCPTVDIPEPEVITDFGEQVEPDSFACPAGVPDSTDLAYNVGAGPSTIAAPVSISASQVGIKTSVSAIGRLVVIPATFTLQYGARLEPLAITLLAEVPDLFGISSGAGPDPVDTNAAIPGTFALQWGGKVSDITIARAVSFPTGEVEGSAQVVFTSASNLDLPVVGIPLPEVTASFGIQVEAVAITLPTVNIPNTFTLQWGGGVVSGSGIGLVTTVSAGKIGSGITLTAVGIEATLPATFTLQYGAGLTFDAIDLAVLIPVTFVLQWGGKLTFETAIGLDALLSGVTLEYGAGLTFAAINIDAELLLPSRVYCGSILRTHSYYGSP